MSFVGIIANDREFKNIKAFSKKDFSKLATIVEINESNIENIRNIAFETLIFCKDIKESGLERCYLDKICKNASYLVINSDFNSDTPSLLNKECTTITFGLDQKATVTISSISDNGFVLSLQENILKHNKQMHEMEEKCIKTKNTNNYKLYKMLIEYIIEIIYKT